MTKVEISRFVLNMCTRWLDNDTKICIYINITMFICFVCFLNVFVVANLYLYNTALFVLFCVNKDIIINSEYLIVNIVFKFAD